MRARIENLLAILAIIAIFAMAATDPIVAHWLADRLLEWSQ